MGEFEFIAKHLAALAGEEALDLKDDAALWTPPSGYDAIISMDTICEGVHFPNGQFDARLAQKLIRVNISDLVAKGADPVGYVMSLCLPETVNERELKQFCEGLQADQDIYGIKLWGGDTVRSGSTCVLSVTMFGLLPSGTMITRAGASPGDVLCVTGTIGDAYLGLKSIRGELDKTAYETNNWEALYYVQNPPFSMRADIRKYASGALDISDGLIADAQHLAKTSRVGVHIDLTKIPLSTDSSNWVSKQPNAQKALLALASGGDDYQTLMSLSKSNYKRAVAGGMAITKIGTISKGEDVVCHDEYGKVVALKKLGYTHF